jgi:hypothetical protein
MRLTRYFGVPAVLALTLLLVAAFSVTAVSGRPFTVPLISGGVGAGDPDGSGLAQLTINPGTGDVCYTITVEGIGEPTEPAFGLGAAHIHDIATGGIFIDLETDWTATDTGFQTTGCTTADRDAILAVFTDPSAYYVNIHTTEFPSGAISGFLG